MLNITFNGMEIVVEITESGIIVYTIVNWENWVTLVLFKDLQGYKYTKGF